MPQHQGIHATEFVWMNFLHQQAGFINTTKARTSLSGRILRICTSRKPSEVIVSQLNLLAWRKIRRKGILVERVPTRLSSRDLKGSGASEIAVCRVMDITPRHQLHHQTLARVQQPRQNTAYYSIRSYNYNEVQSVFLKVGTLADHRHLIISTGHP
jgi:hypothetical protein